MPAPRVRRMTNSIRRRVATSLLSQGEVRNTSGMLVMAVKAMPEHTAWLESFALRSSYFVNELTDDLSIAMVKMVQNRYGVEIWPWERTGITRSK